MAEDANKEVAVDTSPAFGGGGGEKINGLGETSALEEGAEAGEARVVKICKQCMVSQSDGGSFCVKCGDALVPIRAVQESYIGDVVGGKYKITDHIGSGGMGEVYLGLNDPLGQRVAVKFLGKKFTADERVILRFLNEARSYCKVNHPNAVTLLEYGQHEDGALYLITEYIEGRSLTDVLKQEGPLPIEHALAVGVQVCEVLSAAHEQGVIHRDLKPDNLMLMESSRGRYAVKVLDFGIAKIVDDEADHAPMTETGSVFGTPEFMSPEQARGEAADPRADLYAMGAILYYMSSGKLPFKGKNKFAVLNKQLTERPQRPSEKRPDLDIPRPFEDVVMRCLNKRREHRYQSADDLLEALEELQVPGSLSSSPRVAQERSKGGVRSEGEAASVVGMTLETDPARPAARGVGALKEEPDVADADFGAFDLSGEREVGVEELWVEPSRAPRLALAVLAVGLMGGAAWWFFGGDGEGAEDERVASERMSEPGGGAKSAASRVVGQGQTRGLLAVAGVHADRGEVDAARRALEHTYATADQGEESPQVEAWRVELSERLDRVEALGRQAEAALGSRDCGRARRAIERVRELSEGYRPNFEARLTSCDEARRAASRGGRATGKESAREGAPGRESSGESPARSPSEESPSASEEEKVQVDVEEGEEPAEARAEDSGAQEANEQGEQGAVMPPMVAPAEDEQTQAESAGASEQPAEEAEPAGERAEESPDEVEGAVAEGEQSAGAEDSAQGEEEAPESGGALPPRRIDE